MISSYDYYKQIESPNMYLCNPDRRFICALNGENRHLVLRFNDLSELTFTVPKVKGSDEFYNLIESKRLIFIEKIGWFQITDVSENTEGNNSSKEVTAESHQYAFKDRGFVTEERIYMFYNPNDPDDSKYAKLAKESFDSAEKKSEYNKAIPSVVGQLQQQLGIKVALNNIDIEPTEDYGDWTIIYIDPILKFNAKGDGDTERYVAAENSENICRGFEANSSNLNGYDFMVNKVESAFEVIFEFDFLHHAIKVKMLENITKPTNIYLSFDNIVNSLNITENAEDIVTVMSCEGNDIDIRTVNPMGTNYIVDFDYYKKIKSDDGKLDYPWMSKELIDALNDWEKEFEKWQKDDETRIGHTKSYSTLTKELQELYVKKAESDADIQYANLKLSDIKVARDQYSSNKEDEPLDGEGYITAEKVDINCKSLLPSSAFYNKEFEDSAIITGHITAPKPKKDTDKHYKFSFDESDVGTEGTPKKLIENYIDSTPEDENVTVAWYFIDDSENKSYCKLNIDSEVNIVKDSNGNIAGSGTVEVRGVKFDIVNRNGEFGITFPDGSTKLISQSNSYFIYDGTRYRILASADGIVSIYAFYVSGFERYTTYMETAGDEGWANIWENHIDNDLIPQSQSIQGQIDPLKNEMEYISQQCDVQQFIKRCGQKLYDELSYYWIEGEYSNDNIAAYDTTTMAERIDLANELMKAAKVDLSKCSQPQFEMTVDAINFIKMYEFRQFTNELALGKIITIEKNEDVCYRPALMSIEYDLDVADSFSMTFSNASKPGDTAMTFADLIKESSSTSRTVSANWSNLTDYSRNKENITNLILNPLDRTLRAAQENMSLQAFVIDDTGILGRKYDKDADASKSLFLPQQVRIINNTILFTTDNWETSALALGEIKYGENGETAYGLVADVLVGNLILGSEMKIVNKNNTITINGAGIAISDKEKENVFRATTEGNVYLKGKIVANEGVIGGYAIGEKTLIGAGVGMRSGIDSTSTANETEGDKAPFYSFWAGKDNPEESPFRVTNSGYVTVTGAINAMEMNVEGSVTAVSGILGELAFNENGIMSKNSIEDEGSQNNKEKLLINPNGNIVAKNIKVESIGGENSSSLEFTKATNTITEQMGCEWKVAGDDGKYNRKIIQVITKLAGGEEHNLTASKTFTFKVTYRNLGFHCSRTYSVTISAGSSRGMFYIPKTVSQTITHTLKSDSDIVLQTKDTWSQERVSDAPVKTIICDGNFVPAESLKYTLGTKDKHWDTIYGKDAQIDTSDINEKESVEKLDSKYSELFDKLTPVSYILKSGSSNRRHVGLIANEVKESLQEVGIDTNNFAGFCEWEYENGKTGCGLRYSEFIPINIKEIQMLKKRVHELEILLNKQ